MTDDFICRCTIPILEANYVQQEEVPDPKWHDCRLKPGAPSCGQILVAFAVLDGETSYKVPLKYVPLKEKAQFEEFQVDINILGLRDLQSVGILPVKKAFIVFALKSLVPPDDGRALDNIRTQPSAAGSNPTINTLI